MRPRKSRSKTATRQAPLLALGAALVFFPSRALTSLAPGEDSGRGAAAQCVPAPPAAAPQPEINRSLVVTVLDENNVPVPFARVTLERAEGQQMSQGETDYSGRVKFAELSPGAFKLRVEKEGFYAVRSNDVRVGETESVEVTLNHQQEYAESVNVVYSPPAIDPAKTSSTQVLSGRDITNLPYPATRDIRYALPLIPGVLQDAFGQLHVSGASTRETVDELDGFNITDAGTGMFNMRVNVDSIRSVEVASGRYPVEYGKGSGGMISLATGMGDDHLRYSVTDVFPSVQNRKDLHINSWTPRGTLSGPLRKRKAWFFIAPEGEYGLTVIDELPRGADRNSVWRGSNLAKAQLNLGQAHILTGSFLINGFTSPNAGLTRFAPLETTMKLGSTAYLVAVRDQSLLSNGMLLETGFAVSQFRVGERPLGDLPFVETPDGASGNFFESADRRAGRLQWIGSLVLPHAQWHGRHDFKLGSGLDRVTTHESFRRNPIYIHRQDGTLSRKITFLGNASFEKDNFEASGYLQDRWSLSDRLLLDSGVRLDWDEVVRSVLASPRLASSYLLTRDSGTKITWGIGLYYDASILDFISRSLEGQRLDFLYDATGQPLNQPPVVISFEVNERNIKAPRFLNWSIELERKLPSSTYLQVEFLQKRGHNGWTYVNQGIGQGNQTNGQYEFENVRRDRYDAAEIAARKTFKGDHTLFASYTRSSARSNAVLNFGLESPIFSQQAGGPLPWDAPDRFLSWGRLPLTKKMDLAYTLDWRDGYPFSLFNQDQQLVGPPGSRRFPKYFRMNIHVERRFMLLGYQWALRAGFNDVTNRHNPTVVDSNVDSPHFLTFGGVEGRVFTGRIRLLGRK